MEHLATAKPRTCAGSSLSAAAIDTYLDCPWAATLTGRERDKLRLHATELGDGCAGCLIPVSTSIEFAGCRPIRRFMPTLTRSLKLWHWDRKRPLLGYEHLKAQMGVHVDARIEEIFPQMHSFEDHTLRAMAGNSFSAPCFLFVAIAIFASLLEDEISTLMDARSTALAAFEDSERIHLLCGPHL